ncbi:DUF1330 domain-containing protein [Rhodovibrionaceae bacterium A322]
MSAYFVAQFTVKDPAVLKAYSQKAGPVIASFGGSLLFKSTAGKVLDGTNPHSAIAVFAFPDQAKLEAFHGSEAYQSLVAERRQGADMVITGYDVAA